MSVKKVTDIDLMRDACSSTFIGESKASLLSIYKSEHSPARTQIFWITLKNIKLFIATHLIRHHVGVVPFQLTCREDRAGGNIAFNDRCDKIIIDLERASKNIEHNPGNTNEIILSVQEQVDWLKDHADRNTLVKLSLLVNAQSLIDMSKLRLCKMAHKETISTFQQIKNAIAEIDPNLSVMMVPKCVYRGGICGEPRCCGYNSTSSFKTEISRYLSYFTEKQKGIQHNGVSY